MVQIWVVIGLALSAVAVSVLGAAFSIAGLGKLFSGAIVAVWLMAGALELAKFVTAAYLHQVWYKLNIVFKSYLVVCVVVLSCITSMGIFGFLSDAYLTSSSTLEAETIKLERLKNDQAFASQEIDRINHGIDEIPVSRISKKLAARAAAEPMIKSLKDKINNIETELTQAKLKVLEVKQKIGPLIYLAKAFNKDIDDVVKYLILVFVTVFDPLAICLVIALSDALVRRSQKEFESGVLSSAGAAPTGPDVTTLKMRFADEGEAEVSKQEVG